MHDGKFIELISHVHTCDRASGINNNYLNSLKCVLHMCLAHDAMLPTPEAEQHQTPVADFAISRHMQQFCILPLN